MATTMKENSFISISASRASTMLYIAVFMLATSVAGGDPGSPPFQVSCEMNSILELLMCGEDDVLLADRNMRDFVMVLGNSLSGKSTLTQYLSDVELKSITTTTETEEFVISKHYVNSDRYYSLTIFPELNFDMQSNTTFYDCPSFGNFQNLSSAVISSYLLKKVINLADRVKIVLTVSYPSVTSGESERDLLALLTHTARFINNITHFHRSIALMVTKVENRWLESQELVEDFTVREEIEEFITDFKLQWILDQVEDYPFDNKNMYEKVLNLTDILLSVYLVEARNDSIDEDEINRIGLFRRPNIASSSITYIPILEDRKKRVLATVHKATEFATVRQGDFSYILGEDGIIQAYDVRNVIIQVVTNRTGLIADYFAKYFQTGGKPYDTYLTNIFFSDGFYIFKDMYMDMYNLKDISRLPDILLNTSKALNIDIPNEHFVSLKVNIDFMLFFERMAPDHLYVSASRWIEPFWSIYESVRWSNIWYIFLNDLNKFLISYNRDNHIIQDIRKSAEGSDGTGISKFDYKHFLNKLEWYNLDRWDDVVNYKPTSSDLSELNMVLNISFRGFRNVYCANNILKISGTAYLTTKMVEEYQNCKPEVVIFYGAGIISINHDLIYHSNRTSVIIMAPIVNVQGYKKIDLSGMDGKKEHGPIIDINFAGENGSDGNAGSPGNASGHFAIICHTINIQKSLTVDVQGGKGMDGQRGGHGGIGISRSSENETTYLESIDEMPDVQEYDACTVISNENNSAIFKLTKCGSCGGSGGNGGKGGMSGPLGIIKWGILKYSNRRVTVKNQIRNGADGIGGERGENGITVEHTFITNFTFTDDEICGNVISQSCPECAITVDGKIGTANVDDSIVTDTEVPFPDLEDIFQKYFNEMGNTMDERKLRRKLGLKEK